MVMAIEDGQDVLMEILSRLPVKSLLRCKSVSKYWCYLIQNPSFISLHLNRTQPYDCYFATRKYFISGHSQYWKKNSMYLVTNEVSIQDVDLSFTGLHGKTIFFLGCYNGIMCFTDGSDIVVCNPATRESRVLPQPPHKTKFRWCAGFTFDPRSNDYKVIRLCASIDFTPYDAPCKDSYLSEVSNDEYEEYCVAAVDQKVQIYDLSTDSWRETDAVFPIGLCGGYCVSLNGIIYWLSGRYDDFLVVRVFCTFEESFEQISPPTLMLLPTGFGYSIGLWILNDSLAFVMSKYDMVLWETGFDIWLMDVHRVKEGWTKKYIIGPLVGMHDLCGFRPNGEELLTNCSNTHMVSYNLSTHEIKENSQLCDGMEMQTVDAVFSICRELDFSQETS